MSVMSNLTAARRERIKELFAVAVSMPVAARCAMLDGACAGDAELRTAIANLLDDYKSARQFFAQFPGDLARDVLGFGEAPRTFGAGELVAGRFRIVGFLGAGGMGEVYEAEDLRLDVDNLALKTLPGHIAADEAAIARLKRRDCARPPGHSRQRVSCFRCGRARVGVRRRRRLLYDGAPAGRDSRHDCAGTAL